MMALQITMFLREADEWKSRPLHLEILNYLHSENIHSAIVMRGSAGFIGHQRVKASHLVDAGGKLPLMIVFLDTNENVARVLPRLKEIAGERLIVKQNVEVEHGGLG